jgi:acyl-CoA-binding protein
MDVLQEQFEQSVQLIKTKTSHTSNEDLLILYGLYKQIMQGNCTTPQPWSVQLEQRARWDAWFACSGMNKNEAMQKYIQKVNDLMQS